MKGKGEKGSRSTFNALQPDDGTLSFTTLKTFDHTKICPLLTSIESRDEGEYISIDELDSLQSELELILSSMTKRVKLLQTDIHALSSGLEKGKEKLGSSPSGTLTPQSTGSMSSSYEQANHIGALSHKRSGKGKSTEERPAKRMRTDSGRATYAQPMPSKGKGKNHSDPPEGTTKMPKNITPGRFWAMVEPYCCEINKDDLKFLEEQIKFCQDIGDLIKVPPLGRHYGEKWDKEDMLSDFPDDKKRGHSNNPLPERNDIDQEDVSSLYCPLTQRLVQALLEVNGVGSSREQDFLISDADAYEAATIPPKNLAKQLRIDNPEELEQRIKRELQDQGIFPSEDSDEDESLSHGGIENGSKPISGTKNNHSMKNINECEVDDEESDEILTELKKKQQELMNLSSQNCQVLRELLKMGREELMRQELKKKLVAADLEVEEAYKKLQVYKVKKKAPSKKEREAFFKAIQERKATSKQLHAMSKQL